VKLTANTIKSLKPASKEVEYMDTDYPGFGLRVNPGGSKTFIYRYRINGKLKRISLGRHPSTSLSDARQDYREKKELHQQGYDPAQGALETFGEVAKAWLEDSNLRPATLSAYQGYLDRVLLPAWGKRRLSFIRRRDVKQLIRDKKSTSPAAANKLLSMIRGVFNWALDEELTTVNPALGIKMPARLKARSRTLSESDIITLLNAPHGVSKDLLVCSLLTCARVGELAALRFDEIRTEIVDGLKIDVWYLPAEKSKNDQPNIIPLPDVVVDIMKAQESPNEYVFGTKRGRGYVYVSSLQTWTSRQGYSWSPHDCRRTCTTFLARLGVSRLVVDRLLNHVDNTATAAYDRHRYLGEMHMALNRLYDELIN
jgi:integrase